MRNMVFLLVWDKDDASVYLLYGGVENDTLFLVQKV
jgi:hypothetical protein